jgi:hypothetical protein
MVRRAAALEHMLDREDGSWRRRSTVEREDGGWSGAVESVAAAWSY